MASPSSRLRSIAGALRHLPAANQQSDRVARDHQLLVDQVRRDEATLTELSQRVVHLEGQVRGALDSLERMHRTLVESDPAMAYQIVTAVRDDVRSLLVEVTEQANVAAARVTSPDPGATATSAVRDS